MQILSSCKQQSDSSSQVKLSSEKPEAGCNIVVDSWQALCSKGKSSPVAYAANLDWGRSLRFVICFLLSRAAYEVQCTWAPDKPYSGARVLHMVLLIDKLESPAISAETASAIISVKTKANSFLRNAPAISPTCCLRIMQGESALFRIADAQPMLIGTDEVRSAVYTRIYTHILCTCKLKFPISEASCLSWAMWKDLPCRQQRVLLPSSSAEELIWSVLSISWRLPDLPKTFSSCTAESLWMIKMYAVKAIASMQN